MQYKSSRKKLIKLFEESNHECFYCGIETIMAPERITTISFDNQATIEHIYSKLDIRRLICNDVVLSCFKCNQRKAHKDNDVVYKDTMYEDLKYSYYWQEGNGLIMQIYNNSINRFII